MIVVRLKGGLGNQLFQYATGYTLATKRGQRLALDLSLTRGMTNHSTKLDLLCVNSTNVSNDDLPIWVRAKKNKYLNKMGRLTGGGCLSLGSWTYFLESSQEYHPELYGTFTENLYLDGYWQTERYFFDCRKELLRQIRPSYQQENEYIEALDRVSSCCSVAMHVRRGDFSHSRSRYHYLLDVGYYRRAISYIRGRLENPRFFWFSNDIDWVRREFGDEESFDFIRLGTKSADIDELMLMRECKNIVTANSTFSWWAAWLNDGDGVIRIVPSKPYGNDDMVPQSWTKL